MNKSEINAALKAYDYIKDWCNFMGLPCDNCPFSLPEYDYDEECFDEGILVCSLVDIIVDGDKFAGYKLPQKKIDQLANRG